MTEPDIVAVLDRWLTEPAFDLAQEERELLQRARDEIMALRKMHTPEHFQRVHDATRAEALEEAARMCEADADLFDAQVANAMEACATAVRALKDKH